MKRSLTAQDILNEIEFELLQGAVAKNELGQALQTVRQHLNKLRGQTFGATNDDFDVRETLGRLFQVNDMLLTLLQEMLATIQSLRLELQQTQRKLLATRTAPAAHDHNEQSLSSAAVAPMALVDIPTWLTELESSVKPLPHASEDIEKAMRADTLQVDMEVRPVNIPLLGGILGRIRIALHDLALFYVRRFAAQQAPINRLYGDWIWQLNQRCHIQQTQIQTLRTQVEALQARLNPPS